MYIIPDESLDMFLGKLQLNIPWKNLYNEPTEVNIENLYVLAKPNLGWYFMVEFCLKSKSPSLISYLKLNAL